MVDYTFTELTDLNKGTTKYILNWRGCRKRKDANGTDIGHLVRHLKSQDIKINLEEDCFKGCEIETQGYNLRAPPSKKIFRKLYKECKEKGVIV